MDVTGVVLAGGAGKRLGGLDKGFIAVHGRPMLVHVLHRLGPQVHRVVIGAGREAERYREFGVTAVDDGAYTGCGPLAGMLAGLQAATTPLVAFVPVDALRLPVDLVARLRAPLRDAAASVVRLADGIVPVCCLLRRDIGGKLEAALAAGERAPHRFLRAQQVIEVDCSDVKDAIWSINTPAELAAVTP